VGLSGSVEIGDGALLGGQVGIADGVRVGRNARVAAQSGVAREVGDGESAGGYPAVPLSEWRRTFAVQRRLLGMARRLRELEQEVRALRGGPAGDGADADRPAPEAEEES
jgi:UDP-3-O-[3-hydroxymyristoyl] glucosamine N-acyltransferase